MSVRVVPPCRTARRDPRPGGEERSAASRFAGALLPAIVLISAAAAIAAAAEPSPAPILPGLDPLLGASRDPHLLGVERLAARRRLLSLGVDPLQDAGLPSLESLWRASRDRDLRRTPGRLETTVETDPGQGLETTLEYPAWFMLFPVSEPLPGGFTYWPPRLVDAPEVRIAIERPADAAERRLREHELTIWAELLDTGSGRGGRGAKEGLLNLTIPIKLPHTLERIIGKGEKTNLRVSGRERIAITGESTVIKPWVGNERVSKQSLFPNLDMEQQLQINLSGTIGEKIIVEVDHNSEVVGPEATKIKLSYRGTEDDVIQTIETGDVGLTLPGSQLLGYSSNKSGLFGIKVTGQAGRADFTLVASKQKAESAAKSFNSKGGEVTEHIIECQNYVRNRFFKLDLPPGDSSNDGPADAPGRAAGEYIDLASVKIYQNVAVAPVSASTVDNVAAYVDTTGIWDADTISESEPAILAQRWRQVDPKDWDPLRDQDDRLVAIDLKHTYDDNAVLAVIYTVKSADGTVAYRVGDVPGVDERVPLGNEGIGYYRMKLLKPDLYKAANAHTWAYALRNIYSLGGTNIDMASFEFKIELNSSALTTAQADLDTASGVPWIRILGLDEINQSGAARHDGMADKQNAYLFDLANGLLKFPLNYTRPFAMPDSSVYTDNADTAAFAFDASLLKDNRVPEIYDWRTLPNEYAKYNTFRLVAKHAAASGTIDLKDSNVEEGSETVTLDGQTLTKGTDYDIDYTFGLVTLKGDAAGRLTADSQIGVNYQYAPFMGGGNSNLLGFNLGLDLARQSRLTTTMLYESSQIAGHKAKLGEEPSRNLVGNLNLTHTVKPRFLTDVANFLARKDSDRESSLQLSGELAASVPNPNTRGDVFLEDFEGIDASNIVSINRPSWMRASVPAQGRDPAYVAATGDWRDFQPEDRAQVRWFVPKAVPRSAFNPDLRDEERNETQQVLQLWMKPGSTGWGPYTWGGIMRGLGRAGADLTKAQFLEFWVNDFQTDRAARRGTLHIDFGYVDEDGFWPVKGDSLFTGTYEREDRNGDGFQAVSEDIGLNQSFRPSGGFAQDESGTNEGTDEDPWPQINGTAKNQIGDTEDIDGDTQFERTNGYYSIAVNLADSALVDVLRDYAPERVVDLIRDGRAWRKFRIRLNDALPVSPPDGSSPQLGQVTHVRVWYEDRQPGAPQRAVQLQLSEIRFLGSRWEREGLRKNGTEQVLAPAERGSREAFFIGEVNNKENPEYVPPFNVHEENRIPEKESSLVLDFTELERDHTARVSRYISPRGDDYTLYSSISWYWYCPRADLSDLDLFFRVGSDTLNFYEVRWRFDESTGARTGWKQVQLGLPQLTNAKLDPQDPEHGWISTTVPDQVTGQPYRVRVVGKPDLRRVRRYYMGVVNDRRELPVSGYFYMNDVRLDEVKREKGFAEHVAARLNMADIIKVDFDWSKRDADFHGLGTTRGQGYDKNDWSLTTGLRADDFLPLLGFQVPLSFSRRQTVMRPKYKTNDDVELIDEDLRNVQSSIETRESYAIRVAHEPSRVALARYLIDPWSFSLSGSHSSQTGPISTSRQRNLQSSLTYDLRIAGRYRLRDYLFFRAVPLLGDLVLLPRKITLGGTVSSNRQESASISLDDGTITARPMQYARRGNFNAAMEYAPLTIVDLSVNLKSDRDLLRRQSGLLGANVGRELQYSQGVQLRFLPPKWSGRSDSWLLAPLRVGSALLNATRPSVTFNGQFTANREPSLRQAGDPAGVRNVSNSGDWDLRVSLPIDKFIKDRFPAGPRRSDAERRQTAERQRRIQRRGGTESGAESESAPSPSPSGGTAGPAAPAGGPTTPGGEPPPAVPPEAAAAAVPVVPEEELLTPEERRRQEEQALIQEADAQEQAERAAVGRAPSDSTSARREEAGGERRFRVPNPGRLLLGLLREMSPVQASYAWRKGSQYTRLRQGADFWFATGLLDRLSVPDSVYIAAQFSDRRTTSLSTSLKLARTITADVKFSETVSSQEGGGLRRDNRDVNWPDLRLAIAGVERWRVFGGGEGKGWFRSSNLDVGYKAGKSVSGATATTYDPRKSKSISPRWNVVFANGLSASLNTGWSSDKIFNSGTITETKHLNVGVQVRHEFRAEKLLARLKLYKPGSSPSISMDFDVSFNKDTTDRRLPGAAVTDARTGQTRLNISPQFSYQVTRNLSGALRFLFTRSKIIESDMSTTTFGLGLEATFVF